MVNLPYTHPGRHILVVNLLIYTREVNLVVTLLIYTLRYTWVGTSLLSPLRYTLVYMPPY